MNYKDRVKDIKRKCPSCGSMALYTPVSVMAKIKYNSDKNRVYGVDTSVIDNYFNAGITCEKCGWFGEEKELKHC